MGKTVLLVSLVTVGTLAAAVGLSRCGGARADEQSAAATRLCVVWTSSDPGVAKNVCFMYAHNAKRRGWFEVVHLVVWGPSDKLLSENEELQNEIKAMEKDGVVVEACLACARTYGVVDALQKLDIDVKFMGEPLSERLKTDWKVLTF
jgi:hypothetical protein